jgi:hypothetical protein
VLVRGRPNALQVAGTIGGTKLMDVRRLAASGHEVRIIGEGQFWKLVEPAAKKVKRAAPTKSRTKQRTRRR